MNNVKWTPSIDGQPEMFLLQNFFMAQGTIHLHYATLKLKK